ncbi:MAG: hypothetical protein IKL84_07410 [Clostridia bacterium]|nr:hypothetical protein [Clostridia bacterium]
MKKLTVFAHAVDADRLIRRLMRCRCVDVEQVDEEGFDRISCELEAAEQERKLSRIRESLVLLHKHAAKASLVKPQQEVSYAAFVENGHAASAWRVVERTAQIAERQTEIRAERNRAETRRASLAPWIGCDLPLAFSGTRNTRLIYGSFPGSADREYLRDSLAHDGVHLEIIGADERILYAALIFHRDDEDAIGQRLNELGFSRIVQRDEDEVPRRAIEKIVHTLQELEKEEAALSEELQQLADVCPAVEVLADLESTTLTTIRTKEKMLCSPQSVMLRGWLPEGAEKKVSSMLEKCEVAYEIADPEPDDDPPVLLQNNPFSVNFEWVLGMYAYPRYGTFDPTLVMSIFYFIIFGIMFADVGYGLLLVLTCFGGIALLKPKPGMKRFLAMFGYCGFSSIAWGVVFGAYFGDLPKMFATNMLGINPPENIALWFDPLQDPMTFLILSLAIGAVHLIAGMAVQFYLLCRKGKWADALMDVGSWWVLFAGLALLFLNPTVGMWLTIAGVACIVLTQGRAKKGIVGRLIGGVIKLYDLVSYLSDLLSYSRILALGLAAGVIAQVVNILGTLKGGTVVGYLLFIVVFLIGHLLNLVINVLGTFVHTSRLQYIEFLNKFYEDGGRPFAPALPTEVYSVEKSEQ